MQSFNLFGVFKTFLVVYFFAVGTSIYQQRFAMIWAVFRSEKSYVEQIFRSCNRNKSNFSLAHFKVLFHHKNFTSRLFLVLDNRKSDCKT